MNGRMICSTCNYSTDDTIDALSHEIANADHECRVPIESVPDRLRVLTVALEYSLKVQSRYADLLNEIDGGVRPQFHSIESWLAVMRDRLLLT